MNATAHGVIPRSALVLEDIPEILAWMSRLLGTLFPGIEVRRAATVREARRVIDEGIPELALIDLGLPDGSGIDVIRRISERSNDCLIVVSTLFDDDEHLFSALRAGAQGYLLKDQPLERTLSALRGIVDGEPPLSPSIAQRVLRSFSALPAPAAAPQVSDSREVPLSPREREVLTLIAKGYRLPELVDTLGISRHTAADHIKSVYRKLNVNSRAEAALEALRLGLVR